MINMNESYGEKRFSRLKQFLYQVRDGRSNVRMLEQRISYREDLVECMEEPAAEQGAIETLQEKLEQAETALAQAIVTVSDAICQLKDINQQTVLSKFYIDGKTWECIALEMDKPVRWAQKVHGRALPLLEQLLYGSED